MRPKVYVVTAYRWGDRAYLSYVVGVFQKKLAAIKRTEEEEEYRGGKYRCEVLEWVIDSGIVDSDGAVNRGKVISPLTMHPDWRINENI